MNTKYRGLTVVALLVVTLGLLGVAQQAEMSIPMNSLWTVSGGVQLLFPAMTELNQQIVLLDQDIKEVSSSLESLFGENMGLEGWASPVIASTGQFVRLLYRMSPSLSVGIEAEYLALSHHGRYAIDSPDKRVTFDIRLSAPAGGGLGVLCLDSNEFVDFGPWSFLLCAGAGYYNSTVKMEKNIRLTGIDQFTLRDEAYVTTASSAWGSKLNAIVRYEFADALELEFSVAWRSLKFEQLPVNFNDLTDMIDLDFSGLNLSVGIVLRF
jgi:hypothetical protein